MVLRHPAGRRRPGRGTREERVYSRVRRDAVSAPFGGAVCRPVVVVAGILELIGVTTHNIHASAAGLGLARNVLLPVPGAEGARGPPLWGAPRPAPLSRPVDPPPRGVELQRR